MSRNMLEGQLELAICRAFEDLLPDLSHAGYAIMTSQAILFGRRLDIVLQADDGRRIIIELKVGAPPMPHVLEQILDYAKCWRVAFPQTTDLRLIIISNKIPERTRAALLRHDVECRTISDNDVLSALRKNHGEPASRGLQLAPGEITEEISRRLSDHDLFHIPPSMKFEPPWSHHKLFLALCQTQKTKEPWMKDTYVYLYEGTPSSAVLYSYQSARYADAPVCLNPQRSTWNEGLFRKIWPYIRWVKKDNKGPGKAAQNWDHYRVTDWNGFAAALGLDGGGVAAENASVTNCMEP
jgi:hypothetical protein